MARLSRKAQSHGRRAGRLPLFEPVAGALRALRKQQLEERLAAGEAYADSGYIAVDELGQPPGVEHYSDEFGRLCAKAGMLKCRLHDARRAVKTILERLGVPDTLRSAWLGHTIAISRSAYLGAPRPGELAVISDALGPGFQGRVKSVLNLAYLILKGWPPI